MVRFDDGDLLRTGEASNIEWASAAKLTRSTPLRSIW
jgi:hypothetical protein